MGCTSASSGRVSGGEGENSLQNFSGEHSTTSCTPAFKALLGVVAKLFSIYVARPNHKERLRNTVSLLSTPLHSDEIRGESDSAAVRNSEPQREGRYRHYQKGRGCYSPYFLVPKKRGEMRLILYLRIFNKCVAKRPFRMLTRKRLLSQFSWAITVSIDLKDAYFHVPIAVRHRKFFRFAFQGIAYEYTRVPFGYALAP
ncbi:hypothetical protein DPEC_G00192050 [Dallia pectoralis]|uniref:Uncharacterized protein n=1 Tax=Dallia pectoralis TaxID=75939 RepID=A0ACC2GCB8_DALPE|nr:hypothetical protein DPEC_G00192050 [Dallia pectoralis]